jgi:hypothetical protein
MCNFVSPLSKVGRNLAGLSFIKKFHLLRCPLILYDLPVVFINDLEDDSLNSPKSKIIAYDLAQKIMHHKNVFCCTRRNIQFL